MVPLSLKYKAEKMKKNKADGDQALTAEQKSIII